MSAAVGLAGENSQIFNASTVSTTSHQIQRAGDVRCSASIVSTTINSLWNAARLRLWVRSVLADHTDWRCAGLDEPSIRRHEGVQPRGGLHQYQCRSRELPER